MNTNPHVCDRPVIRGRQFLVAGLGFGAALLTALSGALAEQPSAHVSKSPGDAQPVKAMRIGVIGAGSLGGTVGRLWVETGHEVMFSSRHPEELASIVRELGPRASAGTPRQAAEFGTVL